MMEIRHDNLAKSKSYEYAPSAQTTVPKLTHTRKPGKVY